MGARTHAPLPPFSCRGQLAKSGASPLLEVQLELVAPDIVWSPELGSSGSERRGPAGRRPLRQAIPPLLARARADLWSSARRAPGARFIIHPRTPRRAAPPADPKAPGVRDLATRWLAGFLEVGSLVKRLDTGEGSYAIELEEDVGVYDALGQVRAGAGAGGGVVGGSRAWSRVPVELAAP